MCTSNVDANLTRLSTWVVLMQEADHLARRRFLAPNNATNDSQYAPLTQRPHTYTPSHITLAQPAG